MLFIQLINYNLSIFASFLSEASIWKLLFNMHWKTFSRRKGLKQVNYMESTELTLRNILIWIEIFENIHGKINLKREIAKSSNLVNSGLRLKK